MYTIVCACLGAENLSVAEHDVELSAIREVFGEEVGGIGVFFGDVVCVQVCSEHGDVEHCDLDVGMFRHKDLVSAGFEGQGVGCSDRIGDALHGGREETAWGHTQVQDAWLMPDLLSDIESSSTAVELTANVLHHLEEDFRALLCLLRSA